MPCRMCVGVDPGCRMCHYSSHHSYSSTNYSNTKKSDKATFEMVVKNTNSTTQSHGLSGDKKIVGNEDNKRDEKKGNGDKCALM